MDLQYIQVVCCIGAGDLIVTNGAHTLGYIIDGHITIEGGSMIWPLSNGINGRITFNGGLTLRNQGISECLFTLIKITSVSSLLGLLQIEPFSTNMLVYNGLELYDDSVIQFPEIGMATQPTSSDRPDAPDLSPRSNMTIIGLFQYDGGSIGGKVDINAISRLHLNGKQCLLPIHVNDFVSEFIYNVPDTRCRYNKINFFAG